MVVPNGTTSKEKAPAFVMKADARQIILIS
jgi:hypothetical protein